MYCLSLCRDVFIKLCSGLMTLKLKVVSCHTWLAIAITATGYSWVQYLPYCIVSSWTGTTWNIALWSLCLKNLGTFWGTVTSAFIWYYRQSNTCKQSYFPLAQEKQITNSVANVQNSVICIWCLCWIICCQHINLIFGFIFLNLPCLDFYIFSFAFNPFELNCMYLCQLLETHFGKKKIYKFARQHKFLLSFLFFPLRIVLQTFTLSWPRTRSKYIPRFYWFYFRVYHSKIKPILKEFSCN